MRRACDENCDTVSYTRCSTIASFLHVMVRIGGRFFYGKQVPGFLRYLETLDDAGRDALLDGMVIPEGTEEMGYVLIVETEQGLALETLSLEKALDWQPPPNLAFMPELEDQSVDPSSNPQIDWEELFFRDNGQLKPRLGPKDMEPLHALPKEDLEVLMRALNEMNGQTPEQ